MADVQPYRFEPESVPNPEDSERENEEVNDRLEGTFCKCKCKGIRNWPLPIGAFQDQCKQIVINKHNLVKNPNRRKADQLAIYKRRREVELRATENNIS